MRSSNEKTASSPDANALSNFKIPKKSKNQKQDKSAKDDEIVTDKNIISPTQASSKNNHTMVTPSIAPVSPSQSHKQNNDESIIESSSNKDPGAEESKTEQSQTSSTKKKNNQAERPKTRTVGASKSTGKKSQKKKKTSQKKKKKTKEQMTSADLDTPPEIEAHKSIFQYEIGDGTSKFEMTVSGEIINWNVAMFRRLMHPKYWFDNYTLTTFVSAIKINYPNSLFSYDTQQMEPVRYLAQFCDDKTDTVLVNRKKHFEDKNNICRIMDCGGFADSHFQVLVFQKRVKEISIFEYTLCDDLDDDQLTGIRDVIHSFGWGSRHNIRLRKSKGRGKNGDLKKKCTWFFNHHHYAKPEDYRAYAKAVRTKTEMEPNPLCGIFVCLIYLRLMSTSDPDFEPELMKLDIYDNQDMRRSFVEAFCQLLPKFIDNQMRVREINPEKNKAAYNQCKYTQDLLAMPKDKLESAIFPPNGVNCFCGDKKQTSLFSFVPSCCYRSYHADCYIEEFCLQIATNEDIYYCSSCKKQEGVYLGVQNENVVAIDEVYEMEQNKPAIFKQFLEFTKRSEYVR